MHRSHITITDNLLPVFFLPLNSGTLQVRIVPRIDLVKYQEEPTEARVKTFTHPTIHSIFHCH